MVSVIHNENDYVIAWCEWRQVGPSGYDVQYGHYIWINELWVHPQHRNQHMISLITEKILFLAPQAKYCYFKREKYGGRMSKVYPRELFEKLASKLCVMEIL